MDTSIAAQSVWATSSRLLATLVNEGLLEVYLARVNPDNRLYLRIEGPKHTGTMEYPLRAVLVAVHESVGRSGYVFLDLSTLLRMLHLLLLQKRITYNNAYLRTETLSTSTIGRRLDRYCHCRRKTYNRQCRLEYESVMILNIIET